MYYCLHHLLWKLAEAQLLVKTSGKFAEGEKGRCLSSSPSQICEAPNSAHGRNFIHSISAKG